MKRGSALKWRDLLIANKHKETSVGLKFYNSNTKQFEFDAFGILCDFMDTYGWRYNGITMEFYGEILYPPKWIVDKCKIKDVKKLGDHVDKGYAHMIQILDDETIYPEL